MWPTLQAGPLSIPAYALCVLAGMWAAQHIRRSETRRIGQAHDQLPGARWVSVGALVGAVIGSKLGMVLFEPATAFSEHLARALSFDFSGRTVVGGLIGGHLGVELAKKLVGIRRSTGDGWAVALPVAQGIGRLGCLLHGCCYGAETALGWSIELHGALRHPVQVVEALLVMALAGVLWTIRRRPRTEGHLYRTYLVGYAAIRFGCEFLRGDPGRAVGPLSAVQVVCLLVMVGFSWTLWRGRRRVLG